MTRHTLPRRPFTVLERSVAAIGFGAFKLGRNEGTKYGRAYDLPGDVESARLLNEVLDLGMDVVDTAPAYGLSEARVGAALAARRSEFVISTKAGEEWIGGESVHDFSEHAIETSVCRSLVRLRASMLDAVFIHSDGRDLAVLGESDAVGTLDRLRRQGLLRAVGFSGKSVEGGLAALADPRIDAVMVEYNPLVPAQRPVLDAAGELGKAVFVKKPLASGAVPPAEAIPFALAHPAVTCILVGGLRADHLDEVCRIAVRASAG